LKIPKNSQITKDINIENWIIPETLWENQVIEPEIFEKFDESEISSWITNTWEIFPNTNSGIILESNTQTLTWVIWSWETNIEINSGFTQEENNSWVNQKKQLEENYLSWEETDNLWYLERVKANTFQEELKDKSKINIWILDTWIEEENIDLKNNINKELSYNFIDDNTNIVDENWHWTQVSWIIAWEVNWTWTYWVNSNSNIVSLKVLDKDWLWSSYDVIEAIDYAVKNNIKILTLSFWWAWDPTTSPVCEAISEAKTAWTYVVISAWNSNTDIKNVVPAWCEDAVVVW
jgi:subtilisin family serine protease